MKKTTNIGLVAALLMTCGGGVSATGVTPGVYTYRNEQTEAMRYASQVRLQASKMRELDRSARRHEEYTQEAYRVALKQQSAYVRLQSAELDNYRAGVVIPEYRHTTYEMHESEVETAARVTGEDS